MTAGRGGLFWPLLLIAAGLAFLASNLGYLPPLDIGRTVALLWPLVLVVIGIDLALARRRPLAALALQLTAVVAGVALLAARPDVAPPWQHDGPRGGVRAVTVERAGAERASVRFDVGGGQLSVGGGAAALVEATSLSADLRERTSRSGGAANVRIDHSANFGGARAVTARLANDVPIALRVDAGGGELRLDLRDVRVTDLRVNAGAVVLRLTLPRPAGEVAVEIDAGASSIEIEVPEGVEAKVTAQGPLTSLSGRAETAGYAGARDRVTVRVDAGATSVAVR